jgi:hypothetical protein
MARPRSRGSTVPGRHLTRRKNHGQYLLWRCQSGRPDRAGVAEHIEMDRAGDSRVGVDGRVRLTAPLMPPPRGSRTRRRAMFEKLAKFRLLGAVRPASGPRRMVPANDNRHGVNRPDRSRYRASPNLACRWTFDQGLTCRWEVAGTRQPNPLLVDEPLPDGLIHTTVFGPSYEGKGASGTGRPIEAGSRPESVARASLMAANRSRAAASRLQLQLIRNYGRRDFKDLDQIGDWRPSPRKRLSGAICVMSVVAARAQI